MSNNILPMPPYKWQAKQWDDFQQRVAKNNIAHAFLLCGQKGFGAESLALAMGQYLLCLSPSEKLVCGKCKACLLLDAGTHPDLMIVTPEEKAKQIKVDQVRNISSFVNKTAQQGGYKIIVLFPAEAMNVNAANALLKNLEEPAGKTVFILVTTQLSRLLPTIRSRCAMINLPVPENALACEWLSSTGVDNPEALLAESGGAPLLVKDWLDNGLVQERKALITGLSDILQGTLEPMMFAKKWAAEPMLVLEVMQLAVEAVLGKLLANRLSPDAYENLTDMMAGCSTHILYRLRDKLCSKKAQLLGPSNLNPAMVVEELTLDWVAASKPLK